MRSTIALKIRCVCTAKYAYQKAICNSLAALFLPGDFTISFVVNTFGGDAQVEMCVLMEKRKMMSLWAILCNSFLVWHVQVASPLSLMSFFSQHLSNLASPAVPHLPLQAQLPVCFYMVCCLPDSNKLLLSVTGNFCKHAKFTVLSIPKNSVLLTYHQINTP